MLCHLTSGVHSFQLGLTILNGVFDPNLEGSEFGFRKQSPSSAMFRNVFNKVKPQCTDTTLVTRAQHFPSNLYPYPNNNHQHRPMPTHAIQIAPMY